MIKITIEENGIKEIFETENYLIALDTGVKGGHSKKATVNSQDDLQTMLMILAVCKTIAAKMGMSLEHMFELIEKTDVRLKPYTTEERGEAKNELN